MAAPVLGIDLGTTNSVVAVSDGREVRTLPVADDRFLIPSVVSFHPDGSVLVGDPARERRLIDAKNTVFSIKRLIGRPFRSEEVRRATERFPFELQASPTGGVLVSARGETYSLSEISAFVLREVRRIADQALGETCTRAVVTVPANFNELQRSATKTAGRVAGLEVLRILNEPTAAALAYGYGRGSRERVAIFDLGGGTFDVTILELAGDVFEVLATAGDTYLGGDDIDEVLADRMAKAFLKHHRYDARTDRQAYERLRAAAEWSKCQLSHEEEVKLRIEELAFGEGGVPLDLAFGLKRRNLEAMIQPLVARCFDVCEDAMRVAQIRPTQLDNVILVGGSTRIPLVRRMVAEYFGREPLTEIHPDLVVAQGAAVQAHALTAPAERRPLAKVKLKRVTAAELARAQAAQSPPDVAPIKRWKSSEPPAPAADSAEATAAQASAIPEAPPVPAPAVPVAAPVPPPPPSSSIGSTLHGHPVPVPPPPSLVGSNTLRGQPAPYVPPSPPTGSTLHGQPVIDAPAFPIEPDVTEVISPEATSPELTSPEVTSPEVTAMELTAPEVISPVVATPEVTPPDTGALEIGPLEVGPPVDLAPPPTAHASVTEHRPPAPLPPVPDLAPPAPSLEVEPTARFEMPSVPAEPPSSPGEMRGPNMTPDLGLPPPPAPPLLLDVTPHTLGVETVGGFCEPVIARNAAIPVEQTKVFSTAQDQQDTVRVRICQGESRRLEENQGLGEVHLSGLRPAPRGQVQIGVSFMLGADGTLDVSATDLGTGQKQEIRVRLVGGVSEEEIGAMQARQQAMMSPSNMAPPAS